MRCRASQLKPQCPALDKLIVISAVKVIKSPQLRRGLFDLHCWQISNTTCHQSSFQPKELQLTFDPSTLMPLRKVGTLNFGRLTAFLKKETGGSGSQVFGMRGGEGCRVIGANSPNCAPQRSP